MSKAGRDGANVRIRPMTEDDISEVVALERDIFPDAWPAAAFEEAMAEPSWGCLVAEYGHKIVGYACLQIIDVEAHLTNIAVAAEHRRKNIARQLLGRILRTVRESKCHYLLLEVRPRNRAAIAFYEKHGFELMYKRPGYYRNPVEDALVFVLNLESGEQDD